MQPHQNNRKYLLDRVGESLGLLYDRHWPYRQPVTARGVRTSALHERLESRGACFGEVAGWERPNWYAPEGVEPVYEYSYKRQNWFDYSAAEHMAMREGVGLLDQFEFGRFDRVGNGHVDRVIGPRHEPSGEVRKGAAMKGHGRLGPQFVGPDAEQIRPRRVDGRESLWSHETTVLAPRTAEIGQIGRKKGKPRGVVIVADTTAS